jgi:hypothetical protein
LDRKMADASGAAMDERALAALETAPVELAC